MTGSSIPKSPPPQTHLREVILDDSSPLTDRLPKLKDFLKNPVEGAGLYARKTKGETIFYLADNAEDSHKLARGKGFPKRAAEAKLARKELGKILRACVKEKIVDRPPSDYGDKLNDTKAKMRDRLNEANNPIKEVMRVLLHDAINHTTRTTGATVTDGFALPEASKEQGQGRTGGVISLLTLTWMRCLGRSSPRPDPLDSSDASELVDVVAEFASRFERVDEAEKRAGLPAPVFPDAKNEHLGWTTIHKGIGELFPILKVGEKTFEPIERLGAGSYGQVLGYRCKVSGETKVVKLARNRPINPAQHPLEIKAARAKHLKDAKAELYAGMKYAKDKHNVLGYTEHVELDNGTVALIGDEVGGKDVINFYSNMNRQLQDGLIGTHERLLIALTVTWDVIQGVAWLMKNGAVHGDMKPGNQVIDANGVAHLIDLSFTQAGPVTMYGRLVTNASYIAPEVERLKQDIKDENKSSNRISKDLHKDVIDLHKKLGKLVSPKERGRALDTEKYTRPLFVTAAEVLGEGAYGINSKADVFGAGITMTVLIKGMYPYDLRKRRLDREERLSWQIKGIDDPESKARRKARRVAVTMSNADAAVHPTMKGVSSLEEGTDGYIDSVGDPTADALLKEMLAPNPENRMEAEQVLNHPSMSYATRAGGPRAVGSTEVRNLIKYIMYGTKDEIKKAVEALRKAHPDPFPDTRPEHQAAPVRTASSASSDVLSTSSGELSTSSDANGAPPFPYRPRAEPGPAGYIRFDH